MFFQPRTGLVLWSKFFSGPNYKICFRLLSSQKSISFGINPAQSGSEEQASSLYIHAKAPPAGPIPDQRGEVSGSCAPSCSLFPRFTAGCAAQIEKRKPTAKTSLIMPQTLDINKIFP